MRSERLLATLVALVAASAVALGAPLASASTQPDLEAGDNFAALVLLADRKDYAAAIPAISEFLREHPVSPWQERALYLLAYCSKRAGLPREALVLYKSASQERAVLGDYADYNVVKILLDLGAPRSALAEAEAFLRDRPLSRLRTKVRAAKAEALAALGQTTEALRTYESLLSDELDREERPSVLHRYAALLERVEEWGRAHARYTELYVEHPDYERDEEVARSLAALRLQGRVSLTPPSARALYSRARRLIGLRRYWRAAETLEDIIPKAREPLLTDARYALARCYERTRRRGPASDLLRQFLDEHPKDRRVPDALYRLGKNHWNLDQTEQARQALRRLVGRHSRSRRAAQGLYVLGMIAAEQGDTTEALRIFAQVVREYPKTLPAGESLWQSGWSAYLSNDYQRAAALFGQLARSADEGSSPGRASFWLGKATEHLQDTRAAVESYESVRNRLPLSYYAVKAAERLSSLRGIKEPAIRYPTPPASSPQPEWGSIEDLSLAEEARYHASRAEELALLHFGEDAKEEIELLALALPADDRHQAYLARLYSLSANYPQSIRISDKLCRSHIRKTGSIGGLADFVLRGLFPLPYWEEVKENAVRHGVDPLLIESIMRQESAFDHRAVSPAGAVGLLQLLPTTAQKVDSSAGAGEIRPDGLFDRRVNIALGTRHFADLFRLSGGNVVFALAGYNAGEHKIAEWRTRFPTEDMDEFIEQVPYAETRDYIKKVLRNHAIYSALYGSAAGAQLEGSSGEKRDRSIDQGRDDL